MIEPPKTKKQEKGFYKGYRIEKQWSEDSKGKVLNYTIRYIAYDEVGGICDCKDRLKDLKRYLDSMN